jgi:hypothetical protein
LEQGSCELELNEMEKGSSLKVSLVPILKAMAKCNLAKDAKDLCMSGTSFLKVPNSMGVCVKELIVKDSNKMELFEYSLMTVLNKLDLNSCNYSRGQQPLTEVCEMLH